MDRPGNDTPTPAGARFAALQHQTRLRRWVTAAVAGGCAGLLATLVLEPVFALLVAMVTAIGLLWRDRRHGILAGWWPTATQDHRFVAVLAGLEQRGWTFIPLAGAPHGTARDTYLGVGPGGVVVVEHQVWNLDEAVTTARHSGLLLVGGRPAIRRLAALLTTTAAVEQALSEYLPGEAAVRAILAIEGQTLDDPHSTAGVTLVHITDLARLLRRGQVTPGEPDVLTIAAQARRLFTPP